MGGWVSTTALPKTSLDKHWARKMKRTLLTLFTLLLSAFLIAVFALNTPLAAHQGDDHEEPETGDYRVRPVFVTQYQSKSGATGPGAGAGSRQQLKSGSRNPGIAGFQLER